MPTKCRGAMTSANGRRKNSTCCALVSRDWLLASLKLPKSLPLSPIYRVVIAKHYAYSLKEVAVGADVAYANWAQLINSVNLLKQGP